MYHLIEFSEPLMVDRQISPKHRLEKVQLRRGTRARVYLMPHVTETPEGPVEVADLCFEDGTVARRIPYEQFHFVE